MSLPAGWTSTDGIDLFALRTAATSGEGATLAYRGVRFALRVDVEYDGNCLVTRIFLRLLEIAGTRAAAMTGEPVGETLCVSPVIPATSLDDLAPWETTAVNQGLRRLLRTAATRIDARFGDAGEVSPS